jgi:hypothetical protein
MNSFGKIKSKILKKLIESYSTDNKSEMKTIIKSIKNNKDFKELYLFYEEIENKYFEDKELAKLYIQEINTILKNKYNNIAEFCNELDNKMGKIEIEENELYSSIDQLIEDDNLNNIDKKVIAKKKLVDYLTKKKEIKESEKTVHTTNENLLHAVLSNNFNVLYGSTLSEEQKEEFKNIVSMSKDEITEKTKELKESLNSKIDSLLSESTDNEISNKLNKVRDEINNKDESRVNYYRLVELKNGLN